MKNLKLIYDENIEEIKIGNITIGKDFLVIAGPCSVESEQQILEIARSVKKSGAHMLRGGVFKPRTSPYDFQGLGKEGLEYLKKAKDETGLGIITEVMDTRDIELVSSYADILQIGARNMHNFSLLVEVGKTDKPILLKRGLSATIKEWLSAAEYIMKEGNKKVILCERGIRTFETYTRNILDLGAVAAVKEMTNLPVIVDPSHGTGRRELITPMTLSSIMAGCDGLEIEVHNDPKNALSDSEQQLTLDEFEALMPKINKIIKLKDIL